MPCVCPLTHVNKPSISVCFIALFHPATLPPASASQKDRADMQGSQCTYVEIPSDKWDCYTVTDWSRVPELDTATEQNGEFVPEEYFFELVVLSLPFQTSINTPSKV